MLIIEDLNMFVWWRTTNKRTVPLRFLPEC